MNKTTLMTMLGSVLAIVLLVIVLHPFLWILLSSFKSEQALIKFPPTFFADSYSFAQFATVWERIPLLDFLKNTVIFSVGVMVVSVFFDSLAGYAFARIKFKGRKLLYTFVLILMMIPFQVMMIPLFVQIYKMGMLDTYWGLILPRAASPFGIYLMRSFFVSLPKDLEESGRVDGLNEFRIYWNIMLPLCKSAMVTLGIFLLMNNWNDLIYPLMLTSSTEMRTLSAGLAMFVGGRTIEYGATLAAATISLVPLVAVYAMAQRYFVQGIATSGLK
ncbi:carbohydrate ABC transporter permease [Paenibacillus arenilitoris]|uniref:Carbohydrate ABC transporter permease n=1 Tax=Paenibacillus arenilitoris TaxID=2772299 RepID=A0A927H6C6_9BACL|nr:carbohydrate ABC transporter permease [Paenibacillus arenilitoris]MBD2869433.1 carbohydrate ABC transporter permease [Paenibacillus arenilitoris]